MSDELEYRRRGRPRLQPEQKRREKVTVALTESEAQRIRTVAATKGFKRIQDYIRALLEEEVREFESVVISE